MLMDIVYRGVDDQVYIGVVSRNSEDSGWDDSSVGFDKDMLVWDKCGRMKRVCGVHVFIDVQPPS